MTDEIWQSVPEFPDYVVSNMGQIARRASGHLAEPAKVLAGVPNGKGYPVVSLRRDGQTTTRYVHDVVARTFLKLKPDDTVNHIDRKRENNAVANLEAMSHGDNSGHGRLSNKTIKAIVQMVRDGNDTGRIARLLKLREGVVDAIVRSTRGKLDMGKGRL